MARTVGEIQQLILDDIAANSYLSDLNSTSRFSRFRQFTYIIAVAIHLFELLLDSFRTEVNTTLLTLKPHTRLWYRDKCLAFQFGSSLPWGEDIYDNSLLTDDQVEAQQIVAQAAVIENNGELTIKVAKHVNDELIKLDAGELTAFEEYIEKVKDAGVDIEYVSDDADHLKLELKIWYDGMVLNGDGERLDGTDNTPVQAAIEGYLQNLPFNGEFSKTALVDAIQAVEGVKLVNITNAWWKFGGNSYSLITEVQLPEAGYFKIYDTGTELTIDYEMHVS